MPAVFKVPLAENAAAAVTEVKVGWMSGIEFWNPMNPKMVEDSVALYLMFSCLWTYDENYENPVNDLATSYYQRLNPNGTMTTVVNITANAYFRNAANPNDMSHKLTASDVKYTFDRIMAPANAAGGWATYLYNISNIKVNSNTQLEILTDYPKGTLIDDLDGIPIIPQYQWTSILDGSSTGRFIGSMTPASLIGSGPFYYNDSAATWYRFTAAPNYHGATDYGAARTVKIGSILYTVYGDAQAITLSMNSGQEDTIDLSGQPNLFLNTLGNDTSVNVVKSAVQEMGICDIAINAIPMAKYVGNKEVDSQWRTKTYGTGNVILQDPKVRKAIAMTLDKNTIKNSIMGGLATIADSVVQPGYWHNADLTNLAFDPATAKSDLNAAGYIDTDSDGILEVTSTAWVAANNSGLNYNVPIGTHLSFRIHAPTNEPSYMSLAENWVAWARQAGIDFQYRALSESVMTNADWFKSDYDIWVWHWGWSPEPIGAILEVWTTPEIRDGGNNCQTPMGPWWYGPDNATASPTGKPYSAFDQNWSTAMTIVDKAERKVYVDELQKQLFDSFTEIPPFYDLGLYGYTDERFIGWGDWVAHKGLNIKSTMVWLWFNLEPIGNTRPVFDTPLNPSYQAIVNQPTTFQVIAFDADVGDTLYVNWSFGDGTAPVKETHTGVTTPTTFSQTHTYTTLNPSPGYTLNVTLWDGQPNHERYSTAVVFVVSLPDTGPTLGAVTANPPPTSPRYNDTVITWSVGASDHESGGSSGYGLLFTWSWGDGTYTVTRYQPTTNDTTVTDTHTKSWSYAGTYNVQVSVWDGFGLQNDPAHNVSSGAIPYVIIENSPPDLPTISPISGTEGTWVTCVASSIDVDPDPMRFTWEWDDGTFNVTNSANPSPGTSVDSIVLHNWATTGTYPVVVYVDDMSGIFGHNSSLSINALITAVGVNVAPTALLLGASPTTPYENTVVTISASAIDTDTDPLTFYIDFGDGEAAAATTAGGVTTRQSVTPPFTHTYTAASTYTMTLFVNDAQGHNVSTTSSLDVIANEPPWLILGGATTARYNATFDIEPTLVSDNDTSDTVTVWFDWADGSPLTKGDSANSYAASHRYNETGDKVITVWADDGTGATGHNVSRQVTVTIIQNLVPLFKGAISKLPVKTSYNESDVITFTFTVWDYEGDNLTLIVQWGDGQTNTEQKNDVAFNQTLQWNITHSYTTGRIDVYKVNATVKDDADHYHPSWQTATTNVQVDKPTTPTKPKSTVPWALIGGIAAAIIIVLVVVALLMRRRKGEKEEQPGAGMEGMEPPPEEHAKK